VKTSNIDDVKTSSRRHLAEQISSFRLCQIWRKNWCEILENNYLWEVNNF